MDVAGRIAALLVYPVKGCRATPLDRAVVTPRGFAHDRRWMVVRPDGRFLTQREVPRLAQVVPRIEGEMLALACGADRVELPIADEGEQIEVTVWRDRVAAVAVEQRADDLLSAFLGRPARLARFPERATRPCSPDHAPAGSHTAFADGYPLLVTTEASLAELNAALLERDEAPVPMSRFRPNLVLAGVPARSEDGHRMLVIDGGVRLALVKRCDRCVVTTTDQETGERSEGEPLRTLLRIRRNPATGGAWFGQNAVPLTTGAAPIAVGAGCRLTPGEA